jgi:hypothetical protein
MDSQPPIDFIFVVHFVAASPCPLPNLLPSPLPEMLLGYETQEQQLEAQKLLMQGSTPEVKNYIKEPPSNIIQIKLQRAKPPTKTTTWIIATTNQVRTIDE